MFITLFDSTGGRHIVYIKLPGKCGYGCVVNLSSSKEIPQLVDHAVYKSVQIFCSLSKNYTTALRVTFTICQFIRLIHLSSHHDPAHLSLPGNGMPEHVCVPAPFSLSDGVWNGESGDAASGRRILHHRCDVSTNLCCHSACDRSLHEEREEMGGSVCCCQFDIGTT